MLAIVIPYYKSCFFKETLDSLLNQTNQQFKVYIGDDASPENPDNLLDDFKGLLNFEYHRFENNLGSQSLVSQWKRCINLIRDEDWIMILGDDDVLEENVVEAFYNNLDEIEQEKVDVIRFATRIIDVNGQYISDIYFHPKLEKAVDAFWRKFMGKTRSSLSEYIVKRKSLFKFGFREYPLAWHSDDMAWLEFSDFKRIYTINSAKLYIRLSEKSISGNKDNNYQKKTASKLFYYTISDKYISYFSKTQRIKIIARVERDYFESKSFFMFLKIFKWHILKTDLLNLAKFFRRIYINR
ncbi:glycosyltransferase family 2 protein [Flavobacterium sp.]|uniref:glycosyltransferase family 2 protein n=1 Tax=Flavobacterium sp. TaxID=239 RepID=UPI003263B9E8